MLSNLQSKIHQDLSVLYKPLPSLFEFYISGDGWESDSIELAINRLHTYNFFKRFAKVQLRHFIRNIELRVYEQE